MRIIRSFVDRIGGELRIGRGDENQGTRVTDPVLLIAYRMGAAELCRQLSSGGEMG